MKAKNRTLWSKQAAFCACKSRFRSFVAGRGAGKTIAGAAAALPFIVGRPNGIGLVTAPSHDVLRDALLPVCREWWVPFGARFSESAPIQARFPNGHRVTFRTTEIPDLLRGPSFAWAWLDEAGLNRKGTWSAVMPGLRSAWGASPAWITTTPKQAKRGRDDLKTILRKNKFEQFSAASWENPNLTREYLRDLMREFSGPLKNQELRGQFVTLGAGTIERRWFLIEDAAPAGIQWARGWDPAFSLRETADRTAGILCGIDGSGHVWFRDGIAERVEMAARKRMILDAMACEPWPVGIAGTASQSDAWRDVATDPRAAMRQVEHLTETGDKLSRALPWISRASQGMVHLVAGEWVEPWLCELEEFPDGEHDDRVDAMTLAYAMAAGGQCDLGWLSGVQFVNRA